ncbi:MAG: Holliday junction resolvase [Thermoprotei archaeon]|nr:MAG: Holliday junction resolvase [Thermoprotei archaeon]RLE81361.1 MAG: Holliday junction resolvase [Thermoprotei archaeon]RLF01628.1 MAG: Holliday junction resolvase [Thermoprotei archaeon]
MPNKARVRGFRAERSLALALWKLGFACIRGPASGSGARRLFYPDLLAIRNGVIFVFEIKIAARKILYLNRLKIERLKDFVKRIRGSSKETRVYAFIALKIPDKRWRFIPLEKLRLTKSCTTYKIDVTQVNQAFSIRDIVQLSELSSPRKLDNYVTSHE